MLNGEFRSVRALALGLASVAIAFYAFVMPWHLAVRFSAEVAAARQVALYGGAPCAVAFGLANEFDHGLQRHHPRHDGAGAAHSAHHNSDHQHPAPNPHFRCPLCKGLAALQFVLLATVQLGLLEPFSEFSAALPEDDALIELFEPVPQSRGPPFLA